ncbi:MAG: 50S ribosomal protein L20 [Armatimonadetes bacterium]|nr:50S ribosomal protein L20 [Armatimonadota bacterium]
MPRVKTGPYRRRRHKRLLKRAEGYWGKRHLWYKVAHENVMRAGMFAYRHRRERKREFRRLWIARISAAARSHGLKYNEFMNGLRKAGVSLDRKILAYMALEEPETFAQLADLARNALAAAAPAS